MFKLLPWTEGKYHILMANEVIGHTEYDEGLVLIRLNELLQVREIRNMLDAVEEQYETINHLAAPVKKAVKKQKKSHLQLNQALGAVAPKSKKVKEKKAAPKKSKKPAADGVVKNPRGSKWDKYMDEEEHVLTLKQTGVAKIETARVAVSTYAKSRGYNVTTTVAGDKLTIKKN